MYKNPKFFYLANLNYLFLGKRQWSYYNQDGYGDTVNNRKKGYFTEPDRHVPNRSVLNANFIYKADNHHSVQLNLNNILNRHDTINKYENWGMPFNWMLSYNYSF